MATTTAAPADTKPEEDLADYEEAEETTETKAPVEGKAKTQVGKGSYAGIHTSGFRDFLLKSELLMAVTDCAFEHPSEGIQCSATIFRLPGQA